MFSIIFFDVSNTALQSNMFMFEDMSLADDGGELSLSLVGGGGGHRSARSQQTGRYHFAFNSGDMNNNINKKMFYLQILHYICQIMLVVIEKKQVVL